MASTRDDHSCPLCGESMSEPLWSLAFPAHPKPFRLWRCRGCGVVYNWPRLPAEQIAHQYDDDYYVFSESAERRWGRATQVYVNYLLPLESAYTGGRLLDIGSAQGHLLTLARARGWRVQGVEICHGAAAAARRAFDLPVREGTIENLHRQLPSFDVITAIDVVEHVPDPCAFVRAIRQCLEPGGRVILETPNWGGRWRRFGGRRWIGQNRFHLFLFDARALIGLLRRCGYRHCRALSSTNFAHCLWGTRPEVGTLTAHLPAGLRWRVERILNRATPPSLATELRASPPASLNEALACVEKVERRGLDGIVTDPALGDNLAVVAAPATADKTREPRTETAPTCRHQRVHS